MSAMAPVARQFVDQKETSKTKHEGNAAGKDAETVPRKEKVKEGVVPWQKCRPATV